MSGLHSSTFIHHHFLLQIFRRSRSGLRQIMIVAFLFLVTTSAFAQGRQADYDRMQRWQAATRQPIFRNRVQPHWLNEDRSGWYRVAIAPNEYEFVVFETTIGMRRPAFDAEKLAAELGKQSEREVPSRQLPFEVITLSDDLATVSFTFNHRQWTWSSRDGQLTSVVERPPAPSPPEPADHPRRRRQEHTSPNGTHTLVRRGQNLFLREAGDGLERPLTTDGVAENFYEDRVSWSPDSRYVLAWKTVPGEEHKVYLIETSPRDQKQPKLHNYDYHKPGDRLPVTKPVLIDVAAGKVTPIVEDLFPNPWGFTQETWSADSTRCWFLYNQRGHQTLQWIEVTAATGATRTIIDETSKTFVDYAHKVFVHRVDATNEVIWMSERDGWNHLYLIDGETGSVKNAITTGKWMVRSVDRVDDEKRQIWFQAGGIRPEQDPYYLHHCRVNFDGSGLTILTEGDGTHRIEWSPTGAFFLDTYSRVDMPPVTELRRGSDGSLVCELERSDVSYLSKVNWKAPERFVAKGRDGTTDIHGVLYWPTHFDPDKIYPVIECIYAGPHGAHVPKEFRTSHYGQDLAELGFIVVRMDGMGTSHRSKAFHDVCWKNLGDSGFPDRILWMKAAAEKYPQMDLTRVGIFGGSAGGQSAVRALEAHGGFYKAAVADCGCHDNQMDKVWWNELWMSWPVGSHYAEQSNVTNAHKLQGKLLLVVGELDRNVDPASTMQVVDALIRANKDFDLLVIPGAGHGSAESPYGQRRRADFFVRHLWNHEPRGE